MWTPPTCKTKNAFSYSNKNPLELRTVFRLVKTISLQRMRNKMQVENEVEPQTIKGNVAFWSKLGNKMR